MHYARYLSDTDRTSIRHAGRAAAEMLEYLSQYVAPGVTTQELDDLAVVWTKKRGFLNGPLNYHGFPKSICTSVNSVVCHGIPTESVVLKEGDIVNIDVSPIVNGWYGDTSKTFFVGEPNSENKFLVNSAYETLKFAIEFVRKYVSSGIELWTPTLAKEIEMFVQDNGLCVATDLCGHGIGKAFHMLPTIHHSSFSGRGSPLLDGMVFTIEPALNISDPRTTMANGEIYSFDGKCSAQFEHTLMIVGNTVEVLTLFSQEDI